MPNNVYIIGAARTDFRRNLQREGKTLRDILLEAASAAIVSANIDAADIQSGIVGNFASGLFTHQLHLGAYLTELSSHLRGIPTLHVEAACASGGMAVITGAQQIMSGQHDIVLVAGVEQQKTMSPAQVGDVLAAAADYRHEASQYGQFPFPKLFARIARIYMDRYALTARHLDLISQKNLANARRNPNAQMRAAATEPDNPVIATPLRASDCSQITDGAAAIILASDRIAKNRPRARLAGYGITTDHLLLSDKDIPDFPISRLAATRAYEMSHLQPADIDGAEVHDCFTISEILATEILGFASPGHGVDLAESPRIPINPGGGLIGDGHPVGATGVRQAADAWCHLTESAGPIQISRPRHFLTHNVGGTLTTTIIAIWSAS